jgi:hypothetical protein
MKRRDKNKIRCEYCNKYLNGRGSVHCDCVEPYVKKVLNRSIFVTIFDRPMKKFAMVFFIFALLITSVLAGTYVLTYLESRTIIGSYDTSDEIFLKDQGYEIIENVTVQARNSWLEFDGVNDYVFLDTNPSIELINNFSFGAWVLINDTSKRRIISKRYLYSMYHDSSRFYGQIWNSSGTTTLSQSSANIVSGTWYSLYVVVFDSNLSLYVDGVFVDSDVFNGDVRDLSNEFYVGQSGADTEFWSGSIDDVRLYNRSLSDIEILEINNSGRFYNSSLFSDNLVLWYDFNEGSGSTVYDKSGNGNDGE